MNFKYGDVTSTLLLLFILSGNLMGGNGLYFFSFSDVQRLHITITFFSRIL